MDVGRGAILCIVFLCGLMVETSQGNRRAMQSIVGNYAHGDADARIVEHLAEQVWSSCRQDVMKMKDYIADLSFLFVGDADGVLDEANSETETALLRKRYWHAILKCVPPDVRQSLLLCTTSVGSSSTTSWISKYLNMLHDSPHAQRRLLIRTPHMVRSHQRLPSILSSSSPLFCPPVEAPAEAYPTSQSNTSPSSAVHPIQGLSRKLLSQVASTSEYDDMHKKKVLITLIALMSVAIVILGALLIYLLKNKKNKVGPRHENKSKEPPHNSSLNVMSTDSSGSTQIFENGASSNGCRISSGKKNMLSFANTAPADGAFDAKLSGAVSGNIDGAVTAPIEKSAVLPPCAPPPPPSPPPPPPAPAQAPRPPPPPKGARPPPPPGRLKPSPPKGDFEVRKAKLKPFFWDKVQPSDDQSTVWHGLKAGSFQVDEEMMESLFGIAPMDKNNVERKKDSPSLDNITQYVKIIDPKKAQNLSILLRALNVTTEEVCDALQEGNELPAELIQTLIKMAPSADEELKLRLYNGELSQLGPAERFLKRLVEIPHSSKRLESLLLMSTYHDEIANIKESHNTLEVACDELKSSRIFLKLLEAVLKTGNRMNDGTYRGGAQAFKLDTLLKLSDVKGTDGKTTLLHFVVQEMIRYEGIRAVRIAKESPSVSASNMKVDELATESPEKTEEYYRRLGLQVVSGISAELEDVKKAAVIDADGITNSVSKLAHSLLKTREFLNSEMKNLDEDGMFKRKLASFVELAEAEIPFHIEKEKRILELIKSTADYFHGSAVKEEGLRLFVIVRDFLIMLDKVCKEIQHSLTKAQHPRKQQQGSTASSDSSSTDMQQPRTELSDIHLRLFPAIQERRTDDTSSDDDSS